MDARAMTTTDLTATILKTQQRLKNQTLDNWRGHNSFLRSVCAEMILSVGQVTECWQLLSEALRVELDCDRVDAGPCNRFALEYAPIAQANRQDTLIHNVLGLSLPNRNASVQQLWYQASPLVSDDIDCDARLETQFRAMLKTSGTQSFVSFAIQLKGIDVGLICLDQIESARHWSSSPIAKAHDFVTQVAAPILEAAASTNKLNSQISLNVLSPRELEVALLAGQANSYKLIARKLGKSFSTVDHQLRSIRVKLGVKSHSELVRFMQSANIRD
jgi:DNA-binding CsgD family transcriptional regulator